jgi:endonuclease/exonuclease/phosphatase family metal-dependent hydrolase
MARACALVSGAILGQTTFAAIGLLFLISAVRSFTSSLYMSLFGNVSNESVGLIALGVFALSALAIVVAIRTGPRGAVALSGTLLAGGTVLATAARAGWADIVLSAVALVGGTWWLALSHSSRSRLGSSAFVLGLPFAIAADLGLRSAFRTIPVVDQVIPLALALVLIASLLFLAAGILTSDVDREWTSPGLRGAIALAAVPPLLLMGELAAWNPGHVSGAAGLGRGPEGPGSWYLVAATLGLGMTLGSIALSRVRPPQQIVAVAAVVIGVALLALRLPVLSLAGGAVLAAAAIVAAAVLSDTPARPAHTPVTTALALAFGWILFVALAFGSYAYYAPPPVFWVAAGIVVIGLAAATPLPGARLGAAGALLVATLAVLVPVVALVTTPEARVEERSTLRLMTYNVHQGFDDGNVPGLDGLVATIAAEAPDVVVLQEVTRGWMITQQHDVLTVLAERLGMQYAFGPTIGEAYGNAVLSRLPLTDVRTISFPRQAAIRHQPRGALLFRVADVLVVATHLDHIAGASDVRQGQVRLILAAWAGVRPAIVAGDLNALPGSPELRMLAEAGFTDLAAAAGADQPTSPAREPSNRVDYVWGNGVVGSQVHTVPSTASDHRPVVVNIAKSP